MRPISDPLQHEARLSRRCIKSYKGAGTEAKPFRELGVCVGTANSRVAWCVQSAAVVMHATHHLTPWTFSPFGPRILAFTALHPMRWTVGICRNSWKVTKVALLLPKLAYDRADLIT